MSYDNSFMVDVFVGQLKSSLTCARCGYISNTFDPFWEIPLPLKKVRLYDECMYCRYTCICQKSIRLHIKAAEFEISVVSVAFEVKT